jgi:ABC-2 type transport system permease protein
MLKIIKADLYRIFRGAGIYTTFVVFIAFIVWQSLAYIDRTTSVRVHISDFPEPLMVGEITITDFYGNIHEVDFEAKDIPKDDFYVMSEYYNENNELIHEMMLYGIVKVHLVEVQNPETVRTIKEMQLASLFFLGEENWKYYIENSWIVTDKTGKAMPFNMADLTQLIIYVLLSVVVLITAADFSRRGGASRNTIAGGTGRMQYYLSKLILTSLFCIALLLIHIILPMIIATIVNGFGESFRQRYFTGLLEVYLPQLYLMLAYGCVGTFLTLVFKNKAILVSVYLAFLLIPLFSNLYYSNLIKYDMQFNMMAYSFNYYQIPPDLLRTLLLGGVYILACTIGGILLFRKAEIK